MPNIPKKHRDKINELPRFRRCERSGDGKCGGRLTVEEVFKFKNKQIKEMWNYLCLCEYHHGLGKWHNNGGGLDKRENERLALERATEEELKKYDKKDKIKRYLNENT